MLDRQRDSFACLGDEVCLLELGQITARTVADWSVPPGQQKQQLRLITLPADWVIVLVVAHLVTHQRGDACQRLGHACSEQ